MIHQHNLTRRFAQIVAGIELGAGVTGMLLSSRFDGISYKPARDLLSFLPDAPGLWWSGLLAFLSFGALVSLAFHRPQARTWFAMLCGYWAFWAVLWADAWFTPGSGPWAPWIALICVLGNARPVFAPPAK